LLLHAVSFLYFYSFNLISRDGLSCGWHGGSPVNSLVVRRVEGRKSVYSSTLCKAPVRTTGISSRTLDKSKFIVQKWKTGGGGGGGRKLPNFLADLDYVTTLIQPQNMMSNVNDEFKRIWKKVITAFLQS
jgi:hypothetical protein